MTIKLHFKNEDIDDSFTIQADTATEMQEKIQEICQVRGIDLEQTYLEFL